MDSQARIKLIWKILITFLILAVISFIVLCVRGFFYYKKPFAKLKITGQYFDTYLDEQKVVASDKKTPAAVRLAISSLEENYQRILADFNLDKFPAFDFQIYTDPEKYYIAVKEKNPQTSVQKPQEDGAEGTTWRVEILFYYLPKAHLYDANYSSSIVIPPHEFTHMIQYYLYQKAKPEEIPPTWFREGSAVWEAQQLSDEDREILAQAKMKNELLSFDDLNIETPVKNPALFYATCGLFFEYLIHQYGKRQINSIFAKVGRGTTFDQTFEKIIHTSAEHSYQSWIKSF